MTISVEMVSTSSKLATVYLSCPPPGGLFSIYQNASYGLSYKVNKGRKADFSSLSPIIIIEESYLQTFLHSLVFAEHLFRLPTGIIAYASLFGKIQLSLIY